jgi:hypothetical protein
MTLAGCMTGKMQASVSHRHTRHHAQLTDTSFAFVMIVMHMQAQQVVDSIVLMMMMSSVV